MDFFRGERSPISTSFPDNRNPVRTLGGASAISTILSGWKAVAPLNPPKNISPLGLLKHAPQPVKSGPGSPSAIEKFLNVVRCESNLDTPSLVLIQRSPRLSSRMQLTTLPGRPSRFVYTVKVPDVESNRFSPFCVPTHNTPERSKCMALTRLSLIVPRRLAW